MSSSNYITVVTLILLISIVSGLHGGRGSHSHMKNAHSHPPVDLNKKDAVLKDKNVIHDKEHLKEELPDGVAEADVDNMTESELEYYYFVSHDFDDNKRLDGLELMQAIGHVVTLNEGDLSKFPAHQRKAEEARRIENYHKYEVKELEGIVDQVFKDGDLNNDGYITYSEYAMLSRHS